MHIAASELGLRPCPHCSSEDVELRNGTAMSIVCNICGSRTGVVYKSGDEASNANRKLELIRVWNRRDSFDEIEKLFELRHAADLRAIQRWQEATGKVFIWPDHADLCVWLLEERDKLTKE